MSDVKDVTVPILKAIRDELKASRDELKASRDELKNLGTKVEALGTHLGDRIDETNLRLTRSEVRISTEIVALAGNVGDLTQHLREQAGLKPRVEKCEREIEALKRKIAG